MTNLIASRLLHHLPRLFSTRLSRLHPSLAVALDVSPWPEIVANSRDLLRAIPVSGPPVLCATSVGGSPPVRVVDSLVATGLRLRGAAAHLLLCDRALPACEAAMVKNYQRPEQFAEDGPRARDCNDCFGDGMDYYRGVPVPVHTYRQFVNLHEIAKGLAEARTCSLNDCFTYEHKGIAVGENVRASVLRFFGSSALDREPPDYLLAVARRYLAGAITTVDVAIQAIEAIRPHAITTHHGVYVPQGIIVAVARAKGVRAITWFPSYRNTTVIYSHGDTYHRTFPHEPLESFMAMEWNAERAAKLDAYLLGRRRGMGDWSWITPVGAEDKVEDRQRLYAALGLDEHKQTFGLLTNIGWDADIFHSGRAYGDMFEWIFDTIDFFAQHPERQLIIRAHPHEVKAGNRQMAAGEIRRRWPTLPDNVKLISHDSELNTYALMALCRAVLVWGTKTAIEIAPQGIPVVVVADAWTRNKGISYDVSSREEYLALLENLPNLDGAHPDRIERARRFAYHFFFRRMIPLRSLDPDAGWPPRLRLHSLEDILPGHDPGLDVICEGILTGKEFIYTPQMKDNHR